MITEAYIISEVPNTDGLKWYISIPALHGLPDSAEEASIFRQFRQQQEELKNNSVDKKPKTAFERFLIALRGRVNTNPLIDIEPYKEFIIEAYTCGVEGCVVKYLPGDVVIVGFLNNEIGSPIILGANLYKNRENKVTKPTINAISINVEQGASLPSDTILHTQDIRQPQISVQDLVDVLQYKKQMELSGFDLQGLVKMYRSLNTLQENLSKIKSLLPVPSQDSEES